MNAQPNPQRRAFHRIQFPLSERPQCLIGKTSFAVIDLSETSCRLSVLQQDAIPLEQLVRGLLKFADGEELAIEGHATRCEDDIVVMQLSSGVSFRKIIALQQVLHRKFPANREPASTDPVS